jgi:hypothetical protein
MLLGLKEKRNFSEEWYEQREVYKGLGFDRSLSKDE